MVLQVAANLAHVGAYFDAERSEGAWIAYPRQLQQLGRVDRTGADEYFALAGDRFGRTAERDFDADRCTVLDEDAAHERGLHELKVRAVDYGPEVGARRAPAHAVVDERLGDVESLLAVAVVVGSDRVARLFTAAQERVVSPSTKVSILRK